ncbi:unnamed protein product, partial [Iphiclides podalirius]
MAVLLAAERSRPWENYRPWRAVASDRGRVTTSARAAITSADVGPATDSTGNRSPTVDQPTQRDLNLHQYR